MPSLETQEYSFIDTDVAKENIGAVISQYTSLIGDEEDKETPNEELIKKYDEEISKLATTLRNFHKIPQDEIIQIRKTFGKLYKENQKKMKQGLPI